MAFGGEAETVVCVGKFHERDSAVGKELSTEGTTNELRELLSTKGDVLLDLDGTHEVSPSFGLKGKYVVRPASVEPDIEFIDFHLPNADDGCAKVILKRRGGDARENIDEAVVTNKGEE